MAINKKTFLDKCNTIIQNNKTNTGLNPVMELNYGITTTRSMIYFNCDEIKRMIDNKTYTDINKLKHFLHLKNSSVNSENISYKSYDNIRYKNKERATSFDIILFLIPKKWDNGRGYDYSKNCIEDSKRAYSEQSCNWFNATNSEKWDQYGIYSNDTLQKELDLYLNNEQKSDIVIGYQHFDIGNEDLCIDITDTVNKFIFGQIENNGIGIAFSPYLENKIEKYNQFVGFFTNKTNTIFEPYVETVYDDYIKDDRSRFYLDKDNKLYFYSFLGGNLTNLDELPICTINGSQMAVKQATQGVYYIDIFLSSEEYEKDTMIYDLWSNLKYKGRALNDVELYFTAISQTDYFNFGLPSNQIVKNDIEPSLYGIDDNEKIKRGDIRKINIQCRIPYTSDQEYSVDGLYYRLYVMSGTDEINIIDWSNVERTYNSNYFLINTNDLIPTRYYIDIKYKNNNEIINHNKVLQFEIVNQLN